MSSDCCDSFGGRITITAGSEKLVARGEITLDISDREVSAESNQDGSTYYTTKMMPVGGDCSFTETCSGSWPDRMKNCKVNITIVEEDHGRQHLFTGTRLIGRPKYNTSTGEISNVTWAGGTYKRIIS
ncbi:phage tail tube protein [Methylobacterium organophilum]|uniref:Uncharacterized protein n=1 Tax=Methylobacterium organophilum TaxID=410 RepID=A0ABQ4T8L7_METOR|nr:phage tail tube protein [Methylobacterium organophilum]GJE27948.1 hypothetical protein LKMONMHP_2810 [Methylobacterium organophilum]